MPLPSDTSSLAIIDDLRTDAAGPTAEHPTGVGNPAEDNNDQANGQKALKAFLADVWSHIGQPGSNDLATVEGRLKAQTSGVEALQSQVSALTGFTLLVNDLSADRPTLTASASASRSTLRAVAPVGTTGTVAVTAGSHSYALTINGPAVAVAIAQGQSTTFAGTISGTGSVAVLGA